jgi:tetratricopeptide (TPR) repeat protein
MSPLPLCFVLMPFGRKPDAGGVMVDFDAVYEDLIGPAIQAAGLKPIRADEEMSGGIIHTPMFERLLLCEYAVADLTTANANVFYELGVRHAYRPRSTVLLFAEGGRLPFDVTMLRALPYRLEGGRPADAATAGAALTARLRAAKAGDKDSPVFELLDWLPSPGPVAHTKTDTFREQAEYSLTAKAKLAAARKQGPDRLRELQGELEPLDGCEAGVLMDLLLSYRAVKAWDDVIALVQRMPAPIRQTAMVQEQLGFALNRAGRGEEAETVLLEMLKSRGPSSETYGILGRVYKDRLEAVLGGGSKVEARGLLEKAIDAYLRGFEADWRDAYPGINAVTLMELRDPPDPRRETLVPVVRYAVERKIASGKPDYWDYATRVELAVLAGDAGGAEAALGDALAVVRETWEPETTARNLRLIREARERRGDAPSWARNIEDELTRRAEG